MLSLCPCLFTIHMLVPVGGQKRLPKSSKGPYPLCHLSTPPTPHPPGLFFFFFLKNYSFIFMGVLPICVNVQYLCAPGALRGQRKARESLELKLHMVVSCHMGTGNQPLSLPQEQQVLLTTELSPTPNRHP